MHAYPCLPAPPRPNSIIKFRLTNASKSSLTNSPSPLKPRAWTDLLTQYPGSLGIHLPMVLQFGAERRYEGPDAFILSDNPASALEDPTIIEKKLKEDLALSRVTPVHKPSRLFICSPLGLMPKYDGVWKKIYHISHPHGESVNNCIPDSVGEIRYTRFQEVLQLIINAGRHFVIMKRDVKDVFSNVPVAPQHRWLLGFRWEGRYYKETCLSFGLVTATFIFNLPAEALHWIIASFLKGGPMPLLRQLCGYIQIRHLALEIGDRDQCLHMVDRPLGSSAKRLQGLPRESGHSLRNRGGQVLIHGTTSAE